MANRATKAPARIPLRKSHPDPADIHNAIIRASGFTTAVNSEESAHVKRRILWTARNPSVTEAEEFTDEQAGLQNEEEDMQEVAKDLRKMNIGSRAAFKVSNITPASSRFDWYYKSPAQEAKRKARLLKREKQRKSEREKQERISEEGEARARRMSWKSKPKPPRRQGVA